ncbi:hypothetical protein N2152v2_008138 [Parachlorella kessleri]
MEKGAEASDVLGHRLKIYQSLKAAGLGLDMAALGVLKELADMDREGAPCALAKASLLQLLMVCSLPWAPRQEEMLYIRLAGGLHAALVGAFSNNSAQCMALLLAVLPAWVSLMDAWGRHGTDELTEELLDAWAMLADAGHGGLDWREPGRRLGPRDEWWSCDFHGDSEAEWHGYCQDVERNLEDTVGQLRERAAKARESPLPQSSGEARSALEGLVEAADVVKALLPPKLLQEVEQVAGRAGTERGLPNGGSGDVSDSGARGKPLEQLPLPEELLDDPVAVQPLVCSSLTPQQVRGILGSDPWGMGGHLVCSSLTPQQIARSAKDQVSDLVETVHPACSGRYQRHCRL